MYALARNMPMLKRLNVSATLIFLYQELPLFCVTDFGISHSMGAMCKPHLFSNFTVLYVATLHFFLYISLGSIVSFLLG